jgi:hypothetical protein
MIMLLLSVLRLTRFPRKNFPKHRPHLSAYVRSLLLVSNQTIIFFDLEVNDLMPFPMATGAENETIIT